MAAQAFETSLYDPEVLIERARLFAREWWPLR